MYVFTAVKSLCVLHTVNKIVSLCANKKKIIKYCYSLYEVHSTRWREGTTTTANIAAVYLPKIQNTGGKQMYVSTSAYKNDSFVFRIHTLNLQNIKKKHIKANFRFVL